jgi:gas vesicle structural protein
MTQQPFSLSAPSADEMSLLELADRLLNRGVVLTGEATLSVAGVDLIYLGLNVVLTAVENLRPRNAAAAPRDNDT